MGDLPFRSWRSGPARGDSARPRPKQDIPAAGGHVRTYYVAAEETEWDYAPLGIDMTDRQTF